MDRAINSPLEDTTKYDDADTPHSSVTRGSGSDRGYYADDDTSITDSTSELIIPSIESSVTTKNKGLFNKGSSLSTLSKFVLGVLIVVLIAATWVGSTQLAKSTYKEEFRAPFFLVWFGTSWMTFIYPLTVPFYFIFKRKLPTWKNIKEFWNHSREVINPPNSKPTTFLTSTILFTLIWIPTNYCYARALITSPASDVTALFSTAPAFVFILSIIILREPPLILRFVAVILAMGGIGLFSYVDGYESFNVVGVILSVASAVGAALYKTLLKWRVKEASLYQMSLFLTSIGIFSTCVMWPVVMLFHVTSKITILCLANLFNFVSFRV
jgi:solute carrier family 35 protein F3/4